MQLLLPLLAPTHGLRRALQLLHSACCLLGQPDVVGGSTRQLALHAPQL
jgi:hypothetical protein